MAKLSDETTTNIFKLQRRLLELIDEATSAESVLFEQFGETELTISELNQLQNIRQRLIDPYSRLYTLLLRIAEFQPIASTAMLNLLAQTIEQGQAAIDVSKASIREIKGDWNIL